MAKHLMFAPFSKIEELEDGTLKVYGVASTEARDSDGEQIQASAIRKALPDYLTFGAVREMHQPIAAGTAIEASVDDEGVTHFGALVVDASSVKKVKAGVLKGFSIGGKVTKRSATDKSIIEGLKLTEISLVDRPANPDCLITLAKFDKDGRMTPGTAPATDDVMPTTLKKGMYDIGRLAGIICDLSYLADNAEWEAAYEGDGSEMPGKLKASCATLCEHLRDMVDEETRELLGLEGSGMVLIANAAKVSKAHVPDSSASIVDALARIQSSQETLLTLTKGAAGAVTSETRMDKGAGATDDLQKAHDLAKAEITDLKDKLTKAEGAVTAATAERDKAVTERDALAKGVTEMTEQLKAKGVIRAVGKDEDNGTVRKSGTAAEDKPADPIEEVKKAMRSPRPEAPVAAQ